MRSLILRAANLSRAFLEMDEGYPEALWAPMFNDLRTTRGGLEDWRKVLRFIEAAEAD